MMPTLYSELKMLRDTVDSGKDTFFVGDEPYGIHDVFLPAGERTESSDVIVIANDSCGNNYELGLKTGIIRFRDHETDEVMDVATSLDALIDSLVKWEDPVLDPAQVKSVWIDPEFAKELAAKGLLKE